MQHIENKVVFSVKCRSFGGVVNSFTKHSTMSLIKKLRQLLVGVLQLWFVGT